MKHRYVTLWYRLNRETAKFQYNHLEFGYTGDLSPTVKVPGSVQEQWARDTWLPKLSTAVWVNGVPSV